MGLLEINIVYILPDMKFMSIVFFIFYIYFFFILSLVLEANTTESCYLNYMQNAKVTIK